MVNVKETASRKERRFFCVRRIEMLVSNICQQTLILAYCYGLSKPVGTSSAPATSFFIELALFVVNDVSRLLRLCYYYI